MHILFLIITSKLVAVSHIQIYIFRTNPPNTGSRRNPKVQKKVCLKFDAVFTYNSDTRSGGVYNHGGAEFALYWFPRLDPQRKESGKTKWWLLNSQFTFLKLQNLLQFPKYILAKSIQQSMAMGGELTLLCIDFHGSQIRLSSNQHIL